MAECWLIKSVGWIGPTTVSMKILHLIIVENYLPNVNLWTFIRINGNMMTLIEKSFFCGRRVLLVMSNVFFCLVFCFFFYFAYENNHTHQTYLRPKKTNMDSIRWNKVAKHKIVITKKISQDSNNNRTSTKTERDGETKRKELNRLAMVCEKADKSIEEKKRPIQYQVACTVNPEWIHRMRENKANEREPVPCEWYIRIIIKIKTYEKWSEWNDDKRNIYIQNEIEAAYIANERCDVVVVVTYICLRCVGFLF